MVISAIQKYTLLDYPEKISCIVFTPGCNMRCGYCHNAEFVLPCKLKHIAHSFIDERVFFQFLESRKGLLDGVVISGGEPTLMSDIKSFIQKIKDQGFLVKLDSNGSCPDVIEDLLKDDLIDYIAMDIKTSLRMYNDLVGKIVDINDIETSINLIKNASINYEFRTTLIQEVHTKEVLAEMRFLLKDSKKYYLQAFRSQNTLDEKFKFYNSFCKNQMEEIANTFRDVIDTVEVRYSS